MDFVDAIMDWRVTRIVGPLVLLWIYDREYQGQSLPVVVGSVLVLLLYSVMFWTPRTWWNQAKYIVVTTLILAVALTLYYGYGVSALSLLWPFVYLLATVSGKYGRLSTLLGSLTILVMVLMSYTNLFPFETIIALVGLFIGVRSRRMRQDAYHLSRLHLEELNDAHRELQQAHAELQEATVHSMRYAALEERTRLAREIHDGLGHQLTSLIVQLQALDIMLPDDPQLASATV